MLCLWLKGGSRGIGWSKSVELGRCRSLIREEGRMMLSSSKRRESGSTCTSLSSFITNRKKGKGIKRKDTAEGSQIDGSDVLFSSSLTTNPL